uniref:Helicase ATP-binding domain-containing protein n=1 Tax=Branchiostoma floridae TaxID=7739 RepID=C3ZBQ9_BRAFL|eukprot:XP_002594285.1 hypothetical protein BRAFLDRAFT_65141 [Branchiostoma floridae]
MAGPQADVNDAIASVLGELPGISSLKNEQTEVLKAFLDGKDVLALLPTGFGKSLIYQIAPLVSRKLGRQNPIVVVVSPLTALIEDQIREATRIGVTATHLGDDNQRAGIINGEFQLVFGSPERFICQEQWRDMLSSTVYEENLLAVVVDEVHVTYKWGLTKDPQKQAFREAFSRLGELRSLTKEGTPILALTASAELQSTKKVEILCVISEVFDDIENIDEVLGDYPWGLSVEEEQEAFDYNFAGYFDEGLVLNVVDDIDNVEEYDYEED